MVQLKDSLIVKSSHLQFNPTVQRPVCGRLHNPEADYPWVLEVLARIARNESEQFSMAGYQKTQAAFADRGGASCLRQHLRSMRASSESTIKQHE